MISSTLAVGALLTLGVGVLYFAIGVRFLRRGAAQPPLRFFAAYWFGVGFFGATDGAWSLAVPLLDPPVAMGYTVLILKLVAGCAGFLGLVHYLTYLYTGSRRALWVLGLFYSLIFAFVLYSYVAARPIGQETQAWRSGLVYANQTGWLGTAAVLALFGPPFVAALAYSGLLRHAFDAQQRVRVLTVAISLMVFFGGLAVAWIAGAPSWWPLAEKLLGIAAAVAVLWAHRPASYGSASEGADAANG